MMRKLLVTVLVLVLFASVACAGVWTFAKAFPDSNQVHGIAVDPAGKIWIQRYGVVEGDSVFDGRATFGVRKILVLNPDGTPSSLNKFWRITVGGVTDTMYNSQVGMRKQKDGNILLCTFNAMYRVNYQTGEGMNKVIPYAGATNQTLTAPGVDDAGEILVTSVYYGNPLKLYDAGFNELGNLLDTVYNFGRSVNMSADGNTIYLTRFTVLYLLVYNNNGGSLTLQDSTLIGLSTESSAWNPRSGLLYLSSGGGSPSLPPYSNEVWYGYNTVTKAIEDSIVWNQTVSPGDCRPRAIDFSPGGDTAYVGEFGTNGVPSVQMFTWSAVGAVKPINDVVPKAYNLSQNYPNPFNPSTEIQFSVPKSGMTTLKVYNILGEEVVTLLNENVAPGNYRVSFNAARYASGTYVYVLTSGSIHITKKMLLVK